MPMTTLATFMVIAEYALPSNYIGESVFVIVPGRMYWIRDLPDGYFR